MSAAFEPGFDKKGRIVCAVNMALVLRLTPEPPAGPGMPPRTRASLLDGTEFVIAKPVSELAPGFPAAANGNWPEKRAGARVSTIGGA